MRATVQRTALLRVRERFYYGLGNGSATEDDTPVAKAFDGYFLLRATVHVYSSSLFVYVYVCMRACLHVCSQVIESIYNMAVIVLTVVSIYAKCIYNICIYSIVNRVLRLCV